MPLNPPITTWTGRIVWLVGASSGIGRATAERLHGLGAVVVVSARNQAALDGFVAAHPGSAAIALDVTDLDAVRRAASQILERHGRIDLALYSVGHYQAQRATAYDVAQMVQHQQVNYVGALHFLDAVLPPLLAQAGAGSPAHLSLTGSVAGYRGLPQALAYGPGKAALIHLAETLYLDLSSRGIGVSLINPGFVETPLTADNEHPMPAMISAEQAAAAIVRGWMRGRFEIHFPKRFTLWMKALRHLNHRAYFAVIRRTTGL